MNRISVSLALASLLLAAHASAAGPLPEAEGSVAERRVTLDEALSVATRNNYDLKVAHTRLDQAAASVGVAWAALLPTVAGQVKYTHNYKEVLLNAASFGATGDVATAQSKLTDDSIADLYASTGTTPSMKVIADAKALNNAMVAQAQAAANAEPIVIQKGEQLDAALTAAVPVLVPWAWYLLTAAKKSAQAAGYSFEASRAQVLLSVAQTFYLAADGDEQLAARRHGVEVTRKTFDDARIKVEAGTANRVELTRAQLAWERALQSLEEISAARAQAYRALATATGLEEPFVVDPGQSLVTGGLAPDEDLGAMALKLRPEFRQWESQLAADTATADSYRWRWAPSLAGFGNLRGFNYPGFSGNKYAWAVGLQLDWVFYDGGLRDAQRRQSLAQRSENEARLSLLHRTVNDDIENARRQVTVRRLALETATRAVQLSRETLDLVRVQHDAGTATQLDLLNAQDQHITATLQVAQARFQLAIADLALGRQVGTFPADTH